MDNQDWLLNLKVGDNVAYDIGKHGAAAWTIDIIERITPARKIKTKRGLTFDAGGCCKLDADTSYELHPVTEDVLESIKRHKLLIEIEKINFKEVETGKLKRILKLL